MEQDREKLDRIMDIAALAHNEMLDSSQIIAADRVLKFCMKYDVGPEEMGRLAHLLSQLAPYKQGA